jgi:hypothetical protein
MNIQWGSGIEFGRSTVSVLRILISSRSEQPRDRCQIPLTGGRGEVRRLHVRGRIVEQRSEGLVGWKAGKVQAYCER